MAIFILVIGFKVKSTVREPIFLQVQDKSLLVYLVKVNLLMGNGLYLESNTIQVDLCKVSQLGKVNGS